MTAVHQIRRGTAAAHSTFVGAVAEPTYSTDDARLRIHDGATAGGIPYAKVSELVAQASTGVVGKTRYASSTEALAGTSTATAVTPAGVTLALPTQASTGVTGITRYASTTEALASTSTATALTPAGNAVRDVPLAGNVTLTGGYRQSTVTITSSTAITPNGLSGQLQYYVNSVNTTIAVPSTANDTAIDIWVTNSTAPGTISFSTNYLIGSTSAVGALSTGNSANGLISIRSINGKATYMLQNLSTF